MRSTALLVVLGALVGGAAGAGIAVALDDDPEPVAEGRTAAASITPLTPVTLSPPRPDGEPSTEEPTVSAPEDPEPPASDPGRLDYPITIQDSETRFDSCSAAQRANWGWWSLCHFTFLSQGLPVSTYQAYYYWDGRQWVRYIVYICSPRTEGTDCHRLNV